MTRALSELESVVAAKKTKAPFFPEWFSSASKTRVPISRDMENYLILLPADLKVKLISHLSKITKDVYDREEKRLRLASEFVKNDKRAFKKRSEVYEEKTLEINDLILALQSGKTAIGTDSLSDFADTPEAGLLFQDLRNTAQEAKHHHDFYEFLDRFIDLPLKHWEHSHLNTDQEKQLNSWKPTISAYL